MESGLPFDGPGVELTLETCWESLLLIGKSSSPKRICFGFPEAVSPKIAFPRISWICRISLGRLDSQPPRPCAFVSRRGRDEGNHCSVGRRGRAAGRNVGKA